MEGQITFHTWIVCFLSLSFGVRARGFEMLKVDGTSHSLSLIKALVAGIEEDTITRSMLGPSSIKY